MAYEKEVIAADVEAFHRENETLKEFSKEIADIQTSIARYKDISEKNTKRVHSSRCS